MTLALATFEDVCQLLGISPDYDEIVGMRGCGWYELRDANGDLKEVSTFKNKITDTGDPYYMERAAGIAGSPVTISGATNASPIVLTTTGAHGISLGDKVTVASVAGNTAANGSWVVSAVADSTHLTLSGTTGNGAYTSGGTVTGPGIAQVSGMKLGTGSTAPSKSGAGAAIVTYGAGVTASKAIDNTWPTATETPGSGCMIQFKTTWNPGEATVSGLNEVVLSLESPLADDAGNAANTQARALLSPVVNKGGTDTLAVTWNQTGLGA